MRDAGIARAVESAYRSTIVAGLRPSFFINVTVPADAVDVNVHPAKAEVRFRDRWTIERAVEAAVRRALGNFDSAASLGFRGSSFSFRPVDVAPNPDAEILRPATGHDEPLFEATDGQSADDEYASETSTTRVAAEAQTIPPLFQLRRTYIAFEHEDGLVLIDQHSAHERVLYEQFMGNLERGAAPAQRLLLPLTLHLGPAEGEAFDLHREYLERLGFEVEGFGGHTLIARRQSRQGKNCHRERCALSLLRCGTPLFPHTTYMDARPLFISPGTK